MLCLYFSLVYDVTKPESSTNLLKWLTEFIQQADIRDPENFPFVLVGNKIDNQRDRALTKRQGQELAIRLKRICKDAAVDRWRDTPQGGLTYERYGLTRRRSTLLSGSTTSAGESVIPGPRGRMFGVSRTPKSDAPSSPMSASPTSPTLPHPDGPSAPKLPWAGSSTRLKDPHWRDSITSRYSLYETASEFSEEDFGKTSVSSDEGEWESSQAASVDEAEEGSSESEQESDNVDVDALSKSANTLLLQPVSASKVSSPPLQTNLSTGGLPLFEVSAKIGTRIEEIFAYIAENVRTPKYSFDILAGDEEDWDSVGSRKGKVSVMATPRSSGSSCAC
ncbi:hypothetical protein SpCBS45565_g02705 [Spizellomyces sp. 'palustris']|nr:hypothetical protein SpCBS45565_g02705 [Spizellomyces sp. 'palustris']